MEVNDAHLQVLLAYIARVKEPTEIFAPEEMSGFCLEKIWPRIVKTLSASPSPSAGGEAAKQ